jgi:hypothetical protein
MFFPILFSEGRFRYNSEGRFFVHWGENFEIFKNKNKF